MTEWRRESLVTAVPKLILRRVASLSGRARSAIAGAVGGVFGRGVVLLLQFVTVPYVLAALGTERFGFWMFVSSVASLAAFADLGLGTGLINLVTLHSARPDRAQLRAVISNAYLVASVLALAVGLGAGASAWVLGSPANLMPRTDGLPASEVTSALGVAFVIALMGVPVSLVTRVLTGLQQTFSVAVLTTMGTVVAVSLQLLVLWLRPSVTLLVVATLLGPLLVNVVATAHLFWRQEPAIRPVLGAFNWDTIRYVARSGVMFFFLQVTGAILLAFDNYILTWARGFTSVGEFALCVRVFGVVNAIVGATVGPLWPAFGDARARGDVPWIRRILRLSILGAALAGTGLSVAAAVALVAFGPLLAPGLTFSPQLVIPFLVFSAIWNGSVPVSMYLNSRAVVGFQIGVAVAYFALSTTLKVNLIDAFGAPSLVWSNLAAYVLVAIVPYAVVVPRLIRGERQAVAAAP